MMTNRKHFTKGIAAILVAGIIAGGAMTAYAEEGSTNVTFRKDASTSTFTLNIPTTVVLKETEVVGASVGLHAINVTSAEKVQIKVKSGITNGEVTLTDTSDSSKNVTSTVSLTNGGAGIADDAVVAEFEGKSIVPTVGGSLYFSPVGADADAGLYTGTITFEASIVNK